MHVSKPSAHPNVASVRPGAIRRRPFVAAKSYRARSDIILLIVVTPLFQGKMVRTYSWIIVSGNNGFITSIPTKAGLIEHPLQLMFTRFGAILALVSMTLPVLVVLNASMSVQPAVLAGILGSVPMPPAGETHFLASARGGPSVA